MSPEIIDLFATGAGFAAGYAADVLAINRLEADTKELHLEHVKAATEARMAANQEDEPRESKLDRFKRTHFSHAFLATAVALSFGTMADSLTHPTQRSPKENLELVVDDSGAVLGNISEIGSLVNQFDKPNPQVIVGNSGQIGHETAKTFNSYISNPNNSGAPFGSSVLNNQTSEAIDNLKQASNTGGDVVVITYGNSLNGDVDLQTEAKQQNDRLFIVNVQNSGTNPVVEGELKQLATGTSGEYWNANRANLSQVGKRVSATTTPEIVPVQNPDKWPERVFSLMALTLGIGIYRSRRLLKTGKDSKGE